MNILQQLAEHARERVAQAKENISLEEIKSLAYTLPKGGFAFEKALKKPEISFICECKKASPSKGLMAEEFPYAEIAKEYEEAGADGISVLTEPKWFLGKNEYLKEIAQKVSIPCLRKDFTVDEYMIYEAKILGASAVLLICSILSEEEIAQYIRVCDSINGYIWFFSLEDKINSIQQFFRNFTKTIDCSNNIHSFEFFNIFQIVKELYVFYDSHISYYVF